MPSLFKKLNKTSAKESSFFNKLGGEIETVYLVLAAYFNEGNPTKQCHYCLKELVRGLYEENTTKIPAVKKQYKSSINAALRLQYKKMEFVINNLLKDLVETSSQAERIYKLTQWIELTELAFKNRHYPMMQVWMKSYLFSRGEFWKQDLDSLPINYAEKVKQFVQQYPIDQQAFQQVFYIPSPYHPLVEIIQTSIEYTLTANERSIAETLEVLENIETGYFTHAVLDFDSSIPVPQIEPIEGDLREVQKKEQIDSLWRIFREEHIPHFRLSKHSIFETCSYRAEQNELARTLEKMNRIVKLSGDKHPLSDVRDKCITYLKKHESKLNEAPGVHRNTI